jgi:hypothetical protein
MDCWDYKKCPEGVCEKCPAYPKRGHDCWKVTGTKCGGGKIEMASISEKIAHCRQCDYYVQYASKF